MNSSIIAFASVAIVVAIVTLILFQVTKPKNTDSAKNPRRKNRAEIIRTANQRLAKNPRDIQALSAIGNIYYEEENWEKALEAYETLANIASSHPEKLNGFECFLRAGTCALTLNQPELAMKRLVAARSLKPSSAEANCQLGILYSTLKDYEKAISLLRVASRLNPQNMKTLKFLGIALKETKQFKEALAVLRKVLDAYPGDKELLFAVAECFYEIGSLDNALKIFVHLRANPTYGPQAALSSGIIHSQMGMNDKASEDFEIALKHQNVPQNIFVETRYRYALILIKMQHLTRATELLKEIQNVHPGYKDTTALISRYQELSNNRNLQTYMLAGQSDFIILCRRIVSHFYANAKVKITDIATIGDYTDVVAEINTAKWSDIVIFRFFRSQGTIGELLIRDLYGKIKSMKAGKAICISSGTFSEEAKRFIEGRPIDLYNKEALKRLLERVGLDRKG